MTTFLVILGVFVFVGFLKFVLIKVLDKVG